MRTYMAIQFLEKMQKEDEVKEVKVMEDRGGTVCMDCMENKAVGLYPFWHRFGRSLCDRCSEEYIELLKEIYGYFGFNFLKIAFLRERERKYWKSLMRAFKDEREGTKLVIESLKHHYRRLRNYDVLKVGKATYTIISIRCLSVSA